MLRETRNRNPHRLRNVVESLASPGGVLLVAILLIAVLAPLIAPYHPNAQLDIVSLKNLPPSLTHPFGTDAFSRDVLSRTMYGARVSLSIALLATIIAATFGTAYGAIAGYFGGTIDSLMMRAVDAMMAIPRVLLVIVIVALWDGTPLWLLVAILGGTGWFGLSRLIRGQVLVLRNQDYVLAAHSLGARSYGILRHHILPNVVPTILVAATLAVGQVIVLEAGLSYLGLGVQPPDASWGNIIQDGASQIASVWWVSVFPGLMIVATVIALNSVSDRIRDSLDVRLHPK